MKQLRFYRFLLSHDMHERRCCDFGPLHSHKKIAVALNQTINRSGAETRRQYTVKSCWRTATLDVA
jgi:hypothetical protein